MAGLLAIKAAPCFYGQSINIYLKAKCKQIYFYCENEKKVVLCSFMNYFHLKPLIMKKKCVQTLLALVLMIFTSATFSYSQVNREPAIDKINNSHEFVIVIKGNAAGKSKVLMQDGNASSFDFDPNHMDKYPRWRVKRVTVNRGENVKPLFYTTYMCKSNNQFFAYGNKGDNKMITEEEYDKYWEKDDAGNPKYDITDMYHFVYREYVQKDGKHIRLSYHSDKSSSSTTMIYVPSWPSSELKLVLVKL